MEEASLCHDCYLYRSKRRFGQEEKFECIASDYKRELCKNGTKGAFDSHEHFICADMAIRLKNCKKCVMWQIDTEFREDYYFKCCGTMKQTDLCDHGRNGHFTATFTEEK